MVILPHFYFAPISYFSTWFQTNFVLLEEWESFPKQTYRNRCIIQGANGRLPLIIPIEHNEARAIKDIKISYATQWQKLHWKSIQSCYRHSPYFEYYEDSLLPLFEKKERFLLDLNLNALQWVNNKLKFDLSFEATSQYNKQIEGFDGRNFFNAKETGSKLKNKEYIQVFSDRFSFMHDLSILDLICNVGPQSNDYLKDIN